MRVNLAGNRFWLFICVVSSVRVERVRNGIGKYCVIDGHILDENDDGMKGHPSPGFVGCDR